MKLSREKLPLIVGILLPILLIVFVFVTSYLPSTFVKPSQDFIYTSNPNYAYNVAQVRVINGKAEIDDTNNQPTIYNPNPTTVLPVFYLYDVSEDKSTEISLEKVQSYKLDPSSKSSDGFTVGRPRADYSAFPFFFDSGYNGVYLSGKGLRKEVSPDYYNFRFVGWITQ